jgi:hypothetical protein
MSPGGKPGEDVSQKRFSAEDRAHAESPASLVKTLKNSSSGKSGLIAPANEMSKSLLLKEVLGWVGAADLFRSEAERLTDADPIILDDAGARYEIRPMKQLQMNGSQLSKPGSMVDATSKRKPAHTPDPSRSAQSILIYCAGPSDGDPCERCRHSSALRLDDLPEWQPTY